jgi:hypothetical protein
MTPAKHGDTVKVHYRGKLQDGFVFLMLRSIVSLCSLRSAKVKSFRVLRKR